jgi:integrase
MSKKTSLTANVPAPGKPAYIDDAFVKAAATPGIYPDSELTGFRLRVAASGVKSYQLQGRVKGQPQKVFCTIGRHGQAWSAKTARTEAGRLRLLMGQGINPNKQREEKQKAEAAAEAAELAEQTVKELTVGKAFEEFLATKEQKPSTIKVYKWVFYKHFGCQRANHKKPCDCSSSWLDKPLVEVTQTDVLERYADIAEESKSSAAHAMRIFRAVFHTAQVAHGETLPGLIRLNPVKLLTHAKKGWNRVDEREDFIADADLPLFYQAVMQLNNVTARDYLLVCLLTGLRKNEACQLKWGENVDLERRTITVASEQSKNKQRHVLMMSDYLHELFTSRWNAAGVFGGYVFPGRSQAGHFSNPEKPIKDVIEAAGIPPFSSHSLRRTFATNLDALGFELREVQRLLNHKPGSIAERHYIQRQAKKTEEPMQRVSERLLGLMTAEPKNKVVRLKSAAG